MRALLRIPGLLRHTAGALLLGTLLSSCGGGVSIGIGFGFGGHHGDTPMPSVSLAVSPTVTRPDSLVHLAAAASDTNGIDSVAFYQLDNGRPRLLAVDRQAPYEIDVITPADGRRQVQYYAQATNYHGSRSESAVQTVTLNP